MTIWLDEQLSPLIANWISANFSVSCSSIYEVGLEKSSDLALFVSAKNAGVVVMSKDRDLADLVLRLGPPPQVIWLTCGNRSNEGLKSLFHLHLAKALSMIEHGDALVEMS